MSEFIPMTKDCGKARDVANSFCFDTQILLSLINRDINDPIGDVRNVSLKQPRSWTQRRRTNTVIELQHKLPQTVSLSQTGARGIAHLFQERMSAFRTRDREKFSERLIRAHERSTSARSGGASSTAHSSFLSRMLSNIRHLHYIRLGTRVPATFPALVNDNPALLEIEFLRKRRFTSPRSSTIRRNSLPKRKNA